MEVQASNQTLDILEIDNYIDNNQFFSYYIFCTLAIMLGSFYKTWFFYYGIIPMLSINLLGFSPLDKNTPTLYINLAYLIGLTKPLMDYMQKK
ncbi:hypothetical protein SLOPH_695 [Spraguea lophii 42_110]|uniref:Uncharacterized protein n=1 Tax=Spraguea lophii (strain 42_110) TaxID=1358809 RepID=S7XKU0_SPRLO|nr:hypothetical protein SLOPH_695 [Spraguea lophii 42_110]